MASKPNILFFHVDNLGMGELGCYGGGKLRGADTKRIDTFCREGAKLTHYVVEPQCTPTRSALMTGRYPIRSGNHTIAQRAHAHTLATLVHVRVPIALRHVVRIFEPHALVVSAERAVPLVETVVGRPATILGADMPLAQTR